MAAFCANATWAQTQTYPTRALRMLSAGAGGGSDIAARLIAQGLSESLGQPVVVDTRVGGIIIADIAAKAAPDGYTLLTYSSTLWLIPLMRAGTTYDPLRDFAPITLVGSSPMILVTHPSVPATSVKELIALAKAQPGALNYATGPSGAVPHLAGELFKAMAGISVVQIAYKSVGAAVTDVAGGRIQMMFPNAAAALPHVKTGRLRALAAPRGRIAAAHPAGGARARRLRLDRVLVCAQDRLWPGAPAPARLRPRRPVAAGRRSWADVARLLPRQPAEHLYRAADAGDAGCRARAGKKARQSGLINGER